MLRPAGTLFDELPSMTPKRIAYILNIFPKLSETFIAGEIAELRKRGVEVRIFSLLPPREELQHDIVRSAGLDQITTYDVATFEEGIKKFQPDILHAHFAKEATEKARDLSASCCVPFTFTAHGYDIHRKPPPDFFQRAMASSAVVTVSRANAKHIHRTFQVSRSRIHVIPCGVDTERFCPANGIPPGPPLIVCVARLVAVKNLALLLDTCAVLRNDGVNFRCVIVGDGPLRGELESKRAALNLEKLVEMPGAAEQGEVLKWWQRAAVGALTSENEGMPVCLMEAAACGVPVVAPHVGGVPELVADGVTGILSPANDPGSFALALERLLANAELRGRMGAAARQRALEKFSVARQVDALLELWSEILVRRSRPRIVSVTDPFGVTADAALPTLVAALDPKRAAAAFKHSLPRLSGNGRLKLKAIRVVRHKPGKRCVVEYDLKVKPPREIEQVVTVIGKVRAKRSGNEGFRQLEMIWNAGFESNSADNISVPEPLSVISDFKMWVQRKVSGEVATKLISGPDGVALARRIAQALHKLHCANLPTERAHTMADELRILRECMEKLSASRPELAARISRLMTACERLGASMPEPKPCGIHRDFYPAQVLVDGSRLWLIDFDLFCLGDPGLDAGNFLGHVTEQALREHGCADALSEVEKAMEEKFVELHGEQVRSSVRAYATLTVARHIYLSRQFPERERTTMDLLRVCENRLGIENT